MLHLALDPDAGRQRLGVARAAEPSRSIPGWSGSSACAAKRAAATSERSGLPRIAAVEPTSTGTPLNETHDAEVASNRDPGCARGRPTKPDDDELSATTSVERELERLVARVDDLDRRRDRLDRRQRLHRRHGADELAASAGTRPRARCADGRMLRATSTPPSSTTIASVSRPQIMSCTPIWTIFARLVKPILIPTCLSPRA